MIGFEATQPSAVQQLHIIMLEAKSGSKSWFLSCSKKAFLCKRCLCRRVSGSPNELRAWMSQSAKMSFAAAL